VSGYVTFTGLHAAPEPPACPECKGKCCRNTDMGYRVEHMGAECYEHYCEACYDGTVPAPVWTARDERAAVVAWLKAQVSACAGDDDYAYEHAADVIERGDHLIGAKP